jgi:Tfp pilus assembly protein PilZ
MKNENTCIVIITENDSLKEKFNSLLQSYPEIECRHFQTVSDFFTNKGSRPLSGVYVDFRLVLKLNAREREELTLIDTLVPYIKIRTNPKGELAGIGTIKFGEGDSFFKSLFEEALKTSPKHLRNHFRQRIHLNVLVSGGDKFAVEKSFKANSDNVSTGGLFIITAHELNVNEKIWIKIEDFNEIPPIECTSKWYLKWGTTFKTLPGYGLQFANLNSNQIEEINKIISKSWTDNSSS